MNTQEFKRRLTAILSADVEGYSRLMREDEEATVRTITSYRTAMTHLIEQYRGRVVDSPGDNILAEFTSVVDAVNSAVEIQRELAERNAELPENRRMQFRIGINLGDVLEEGKRIYGDGVNIAARMEGLAEAGGITISGTVHDAIENKIGLEYEDLGDHQVKNIDKPVRAYRVLSFPGAAAHRVVKAKRAVVTKWRNAMIAIAVVVVAGTAFAVWNFYGSAPKIEPASKENMAFALPEEPSIAVLPFVNMSEDPKQEFLSDGITEEIITALSKVRHLFVISRQSTFSYKGKPVKVKQVSEELGVRYVLEGSVQKSGDRVRINAQLIDALTGRHVWAERYQGELTDIFALQDEITMKVLHSIQVKLTRGELRRPENYFKGKQGLDCYLKLWEGISHLQSYNVDGTKMGRRSLEESMEMCPGNPMTYAAMSWVHYLEYWLRLSPSPQDSIHKGIELAEKALAMDDSLAAAHGFLSSFYTLKREHEKAVSEGERGVALEPGSAVRHVQYGMSLYFAGRPEEAVPILQKAIRLNPFGESNNFVFLGFSCRATGRFEEAVSAFKKALQRAPDNVFAHLGLAATYSDMGRAQEARVEAAEVLKIIPMFSLDYYATRLPNKDQATKDKYIDALRKAGLQ